MLFAASVLARCWSSWAVAMTTTPWRLVILWAVVSLALAEQIVIDRAAAEEWQGFRIERGFLPLPVVARLRRAAQESASWDSIFQKLNPAFEPRNHEWERASSMGDWRRQQAKLGGAEMELIRPKLELLMPRRQFQDVYLLKRGRGSERQSVHRDSKRGLSSIFSLSEGYTVYAVAGR